MVAASLISGMGLSGDEDLGAAGVYGNDVESGGEGKGESVGGLAGAVEGDAAEIGDLYFLALTV